MNSNLGLYHSSFEHDACGVGFVANINGTKSHHIISDALTVLENMEHRGACGCENNTGDGAGIMIQKPHRFLVSECTQRGIDLPAEAEYGVGILFFPAVSLLVAKCKLMLSEAADKLDLVIIDYRKVPVNKADIGASALSVEPYMEQIFVTFGSQLLSPESLERKLYVFRNYASHQINAALEEHHAEFYIASLSCKTLVYKGQLTSTQLRHYFTDLTNPLIESAFGIVHSRFATNTLPSWKLAHPYRMLAHNGEINTLQGNLNWLKTNEKGFQSPLFTTEEMQMLLPIISKNTQSDSMCIDNMLEILVLAGRSVPHAMMMLIPEAWDGDEQMERYKKDFYEFHSSFMEPWDGPAAILFTDGKLVGATLDRNGLRPARYCITQDGMMVLASETGVLPLNPANIVEKGRLQPGKMLVIDLEKGVLIRDEELKNSICKQQPYGTWLNKYKIRLEELPDPRILFTPLGAEQVFKYQKAFGYSAEDLTTILAPMCLEGKEPIGSMGTDVPLAVLSQHPQHLSAYFKQLFAQVTNPPIDPIREKLVMSLSTFAGNNGNLLVESPLMCHCIALHHPVLSNYELEKIRSVDTGLFQAKTLQCYFYADGQPNALKKGLTRLCNYAEDAVRDGFKVLILQDRAIDSKHAPIPSLLATSAVHHHLIHKGLRGQVGLIVEAGDVWEVHHFACLIGFGATAINPYLALSSIQTMHEKGKLQTELTEKQLKKNYIKAINEGLLKVFSKMGISTLQSYQGAQIFEILGLNKEVVNQYFTGTTSRIEGMSLDDIATETLFKHQLAYNHKQFPVDRLPVGGVYQWLKKGEVHLFNPQTIHLLQHATKMNDYDTYKKYAAAVNDQTTHSYTLRSLLAFKKTRVPIPIATVEPAANILKRFATGAMSFGSISWEAHTTLAIAMNQIGAKSNTGEGGEDEQRYTPLPNGDDRRSAIKQVASARFGVTANYLHQAKELQIKMAQGAKPGEGGQLPGHKVDEWIGKTRHATPGVGLISPPPHHDIYSIEDLAQLISDLKHANRHARINVKLVSKAGVGTIASGVTKAKADVVLIAGHDGGTGASPLSSIKHTGLPWEMGLAETQQTLVKNGLRARVVLQADGQMKTGRDIAIATLLGAEEWGVATAALVVEGCIMMRKCHLNTCPVGIATQDTELRKNYTGDVKHIINFFNFLVQDLREIMAELGFRTINEMVGQSQMIEAITPASTSKCQNIDLSSILFKPFNKAYPELYNTTLQDHGLDNEMDWQMIRLAQPAIERQQPIKHAFSIKNTDRTIGTLLSHEVTKRYGSKGLPENTITFSFTGTAGQSFGAFVNKGITLCLEGDANDYFGKGLSGGKLVVYPSTLSTFKAEENSIIGNVAFYGATSGKAFVSGKAGERFAVRNSGAVIVVESIGDHGCEYMTGGIVVVLGKTGRNFGAGMSGGLAYVYDVEENFQNQCNTEMINLYPLEPTDIEPLQSLIHQHVQHTQSVVAQFILNDWNTQIKNFTKVFPIDYEKAIKAKTISQSISLPTF